MTSMLADLVVGVALAFTAAFAATAFLGMDKAAAWLAFGLVVTGATRIVVIALEALSPDY